MPTLSDIASMRKTPRNAGWGAISDLLGYIDQNALQKQFGYRNPVTGAISEAVGIPAASRVADKLSYGEPITNVGKANVPLIPEDTAEAAMFAAPIAGAYGKVAKKMAGEAINNAMVYGEGKLAKITPQPMRIFVGPNSATFDKVNAVRAHEMEKAGVDPEKIWQETNTFRGPDKQWRQEISDENLQINDYRGTGGAIAINHPELQAAYEQIPRGVKVRPNPQIEGMAAYEEPKDSLYWKLGEGGTIHVPTNEKLPKDIYAHELQHAVQAKEGFARGGSPSQMILVLEDLAKKKREEAKTFFAQSTNNDPLNPQIIKPGARQKGLALEKEARELESKAMLAYHSEQAKMDLYKNLAGEAEARAVQSRVGMTPAQRKQTFPLNSYDVPLKDLIYRYK